MLEAQRAESMCSVSAMIPLVRRKQAASKVDLTANLLIRTENLKMSQNLFIGSIAYASTDDSLKAFFEAIGEVESARIVTDRDTGRSKGFGFVTYVDEANNQKAIDELNGKELDGRAINVSLARPKEDRPKRDFNGGDNNGGGAFRQRSW